MNSDGYLPSREAAREISTTFNETELNNCSSIYYTDTQEISLDYKKDLLMFNALIKKNSKKAEDLTTFDIFKILDQNPHVVKINSAFKLKYTNKIFQKRLKNYAKFKNEKN